MGGRVGDEITELLGERSAWAIGRFCHLGAFFEGEGDIERSICPGRKDSAGCIAGSKYSAAASLLGKWCKKEVSALEKPWIPAIPIREGRGMAFPTLAWMWLQVSDGPVMDRNLA